MSSLPTYEHSVAGESYQFPPLPNTADAPPSSRMQKTRSLIITSMRRIPQSLCDANANGYDTREEVWDSNNPVRVPPNVEIPLWAVEAVFGQSVAIGITNDYKVPAFRGYVHDGIRLKASHSLYSRLLLQIESPSAVYFEVVCSNISSHRILGFDSGSCPTHATTNMGCSKPFMFDMRKWMEFLRKTDVQMVEQHAKDTRQPIRMHLDMRKIPANAEDVGSGHFLECSNKNSNNFAKISPAIKAQLYLSQARDIMKL
ncbi:hypothetical protein HDU84_009154 [Entophlyctis sp. JEL0112]|nr:hypothetical protein HDU84_009154 [Entophlyctis sp. JEL0112]